MEFFSKLWSLQYDVCLKCGSFRTHEAFFCRHCWREHRYNFSTYPLGLQLEPFKIQYLLKWHPGASDSLSLLFRKLKGPKQFAAWHFLAHEFIRAYVRCEGVEDEEPGLFIAIPPRRIHIRDHAGIFAKELSEILCWPLLENILKRRQEEEQKGKRRQERKAVQFDLNEKFSSELLADRRIILVDDILTTGATLSAAKLALGGSPHIEAWILANRTI